MKQVGSVRDELVWAITALVRIEAGGRAGKGGATGGIRGGSVVEAEWGGDNGGSEVGELEEAMMLVALEEVVTLVEPNKVFPKW